MRELVGGGLLTAVELLELHQLLVLLLLELVLLRRPLRLAVGETVILLQPPLPLVGVSIRMERGCQ